MLWERSRWKHKKQRKSFSLHLITNDHLKTRGLLPSGALPRTRCTLEQAKEQQRKQIIAYVRLYNSNVASGATPIGSAVAHPIESTAQDSSHHKGSHTVSHHKDSQTVLITRTRRQFLITRT